MDKVRFGRALGYGARHATKALVQAVDAATTPSPPRRSTSSEPSIGSAPTHPVQRPVQRPAMPLKPIARSVAAPLKKFTSVLWLQVTGVFFAFVAAFLSQGLWTHRADLTLGSGSHQFQRLLLHGAAFLFFAYFAVSNFLRARRREKL